MSPSQSPTLFSTPEDNLLTLLARDEGPILEFKVEIHHIDDENEKVRNQQKDEFIKDIIALANGNTVYAGETAYLVLGAENKKNEDGTRATLDVGNHRLTASRILDIVNSACDPKIEDLDCEELTINGKRLLLVTIQPTPYLHETTRILRPSPKSVFSERTAFIRREQSIGIASQKERETIAQIKRFRFSEKRNPPGVPFGVLLGSFVGSVMGYSVLKNRHKLPDNPDMSAPAGLAGAIFGATLGWASARTYKDFYEIRSYWHKVPRHLRLPGIAASFGVAAIIVRALRYAFSHIRPKLNL
jgi:hypothetical protein